MAEILVFTPKIDVAAAENLQEFVEMCRSKLTVFGAGLDFDGPIWDVTDALLLKGHGNKRFRLNFTNWHSVGKREITPMAEPFLSFSKAYIRYLQGMRPSKVLACRMAALRALEAVLSENGQVLSPVMIDAFVLNRAAQLVADRFSEGNAYRIGGQLEILANFLSENRMTCAPLNWRNHIKRPSDTSRVGKEFDTKRAEKLPSTAALSALPKIFQLAIEPCDVIVCSVAAILCSAPDRINEVLLLPVDCEVRQKIKGGSEAYGLRWWPAKGADPMVKWIVPSMAGVVAKAVANIRKCSDAARKVAIWYELHPDQIYLPNELEYLRGRDHLSMSELGAILWGRYTDATGPYSWCHNQGLVVTKRGKQVYVPMAEVKRAILNQLPDRFPVLNSETGLNFSEALFLVRRHELSTQKTVMTGVIDPVSIDQINNGLGARSAYGFKSIFERFGFREPDGSPIKVTTHQFRHYLNTLAQAGGMSQLDIAKWSGRKDIRQNETYDHITADEMVLKIRESIGDEEQMFGPLAALPKNIPILRDEFARLKIPTAHTTDFGFCVHDYTMSPCQLHGDCINCGEQVCVKGDEIRSARVRARLVEAKELLASAENAVNEGYRGGDRWMIHHRETVGRLTQLCAILDDPVVPIGAVIQLSNLSSLSRIDQAAEARFALEDVPTDPEPVEMLPRMRDILSEMGKANG